MIRSSDGFAALAAALVKVQAELDGPEVSQHPTTRMGRAVEEQGAFRSASLPGGLDRVRRTLCRHELATVQTTSVDGTLGMVNLTTTLIHSSGEWVASEWPVGPAAAVANPQRMGAALSYARRCALFTLVGISCQDDRDAGVSDAPGLVFPVGMGPAANPISNLDAAIVPERPESAGKKPRAGSASRLPTQDSARLREGMLAEIQALEAKDAPGWAANMQPTKKRLTAECAQLLEEAFAANFPEFANVAASSSAAEQPEQVVRGKEDPSSGPGEKGQGIVAMAKTVRYRNKEHLRFVGTQPCLVCARQPADAHHLRFAQPQALGRKVSDEFVVPLCRTHHRELHRSGNELQWWSDRKLTPLASAAELWKQTQFAQGGH